MPQFSNRARVIAVGTVCAAAGAGAGTVAVAGASTAHSSTPASHSASAGSTPHRRARGALRRLVRRSVHGELTIHTPGGFRTVTLNRGTVDAVSGDTLTMTDGTPKAADQKQTITVPTGSRVRNDRRAASLSSLTAGERVIVVQLPKRTVVIARAAKGGASTGAAASASSTTTS